MEIKSSKGDKTYTVTLNPDTCSCPAGIMGKECRHIRLAKHKNMPLEVNTRFIKFSSSKQEVQSLPEIDEEVTFIVTGTVVKKEQFTNNDGTVDLVAVVKPFNVSLGHEEEHHTA